MGVISELNYKFGEKGTEGSTTILKADFSQVLIDR
jgi:hypothetical protein